MQMFLTLQPNEIMRAIQKTNIVDIKEHDLEVIMDLCIELNSLNKAISLLIKQGSIKDYCTDVYFRRINKNPRYERYMSRKKEVKKNMEKLAFMFRKKGYSYSKIAKMFNLAPNRAFYLANPGKPKQYKNIDKQVKQVQRKQALKLVDDWNEYNIENRFPTDETIQAFEYLNLTPPARS